MRGVAASVSRGNTGDKKKVEVVGLKGVVKKASCD